MEVYRITQAAFADDLSGKGSWLYGGRWNSEGVFALYASQTRALALMETLVHTTVSSLRERRYEIVTIHVPDILPVFSIDIAQLPGNWDAYNNYNTTQKIGDYFLKDQQCALFKVPAALIPEEFNYIINPLSVFASQITISGKRELAINDKLLQAF